MEDLLMLTSYKFTDFHRLHQTEHSGDKKCKSSEVNIIVRELNAKDGRIIVEKDQILKAWSDYVKNLYEDNRDGHR